MSMPHPRVMMAPFGCAVVLNMTRSGATLSIYTDISALVSKYPGLGSFAASLPNYEDLPQNDYETTGDPPAVMAQSTVTVHKTWTAYKLAPGAENTPHALTRAELQSSIVPGFLYFLGPRALARSKARAKSVKKKKVAKKKPVAKRR